jgi:2-polyprenyl-3-methyl-5-hydroxy-6-metoxy-1,4-benzoquinol methylase
MKFSQNLEARIEHWSHGWTAKNQGDSDPSVLINYAKYYMDADVLEIGPGEGRAFEIIRRIVKSYTIADISQNVLDCPVWDGVDKMLLRGYDDTFNKQFDVIHFWYVMHHIPRCEVWDFFTWIMAHLKKDGMLLFNTPYLNFAGGAYKDDGVLTTRYTIGEITNLLEPHFIHLYIDGTKIGKSNGHIYVGKKL